MARIVGRQRIREGRGIGERMAEVAVYIAIVVALAYGIRWYFAVYRATPQFAINGYLHAVKAGKPDPQWDMLTKRSQGYFQSRDDFADKWPLARGLAGRLRDWTLSEPKISGETATVDATLQITKAGQELYQAATNAFQDRYVLVKGTDGWKVELDRSILKSKEAARSQGR